jgi:hypothetical protein
MKSLTDKEYMELCLKLVEEQYDDAIDDYDIDKMEWIPSEPEIKKNIPKPDTWATIDLTNVLSTKIKEEILKCTNIRVGSFKVRIARYNGVPSQEGSKLCADLEIKEIRTKTPSGAPCGPSGVEYSADVLKDSRFKGRPWLKYFKDGSYAHNVPIDTVVEIIRWLQALKKLTAFL